MQQRVADFRTGGERDRAAGLLAPMSGASDRGLSRVRSLHDASHEAARRGEDTPSNRFDPAGRGPSCGRLPPARDPAFAAAQHGLERETQRRVGILATGCQVFLLDLVVAHGAEPSTQVAQAAARGGRGPGGEQGAPGRERLTEPSRGDPQVVDGFGIGVIGALTCAPCRRVERRHAALQVGGEALGECGGVHGRLSGG